MLESLRLDDSMVCADGRDHHKRKHVSNQQAMFQQVVHNAQYQPVPKRQRCRQTRTADSCHVHVKTLCGKTVKIDIPSLKQTRVSELKQMLEQVRSSERFVCGTGGSCVAVYSPALPLPLLTQKTGTPVNQIRLVCRQHLMVDHQVVMPNSRVAMILQVGGRVGRAI